MGMIKHISDKIDAAGGNGENLVISFDLQF